MTTQVFQIFPVLGNASVRLASERIPSESEGSTKETLPRASTTTMRSVSGSAKKARDMPSGSDGAFRRTMRMRESGVGVKVWGLGCGVCSARECQPFIAVDFKITRPVLPIHTMVAIFLYSPSLSLI